MKKKKVEKANEKEAVKKLNGKRSCEKVLFRLSLSVYPCFQFQTFHR